MVSAALALSLLAGCAGGADRPEPAAQNQAKTQARGPSRDDSAARGFRYDVELQGVEDIGIKQQLLSASALQRRRSERLLSFATLQSRLRDDLDALSSVLRSQGYYGARLTGRVRRQERRPVAEIVVAPGPRYAYAEPVLAFEGAARPPDDVVAALRQRLTVKADAPALAKPVIDSQGRLARALPELGYPFAEVAGRDVVVDHAARTLAVTYRIASGPRAAFGATRFDGLTSINPAYLDRLKPWQPGAAYDQDQADLYQRRLSRTGLFDLIEVSPRRPDTPAAADPAPETETGDAPPDDAGAARTDAGQAAGQRVARAAGDRVPATMMVTATEAQHRTISTGAGYATTTGFEADVTWEHRNWLGAGERLRLTGRGAQISQALTAEFTKPHFRRLNQSLLANLGFKRQDTDAFTERTATVGVGLDRQLTRRWSVGASADLTYSDITQSGVRDQFGLAALPINARYDGTDSLLNPVDGYRVTLRTAPNLGVGGSTFFFERNEILASAYWPLDQAAHWVVAARTRLGSLVGADTDTIPANRRFFAGGGGSIRGFGFQDVGPKDAEGDPVGGRSVAEAGLELRWRFAETFGLVPFVEAGNVYDDTLPGFGSVKAGAGLGVRYYTSFGPIRFDVATPINPGPQDRRVQFYISIGQSF
ncbi:hypothetical protein CCR85_10125 [Rhodothalassium salexigens]|uniref:BamA/TamA family outer membrane protein n=1 Tax=Rhodothalassium salexigens TaxID=1086 RepID=UPI001911A5EE|nr:hypothetical protein [Rhodothalassium salexigens]MBK5922058.1 hypothetical protein [Rhodothalassium salexigens]